MKFLKVRGAHKEMIEYELLCIWLLRMHASGGSHAHCDEQIASSAFSVEYISVSLDLINSAATTATIEAAEMCARATPSRTSAKPSGLRRAALTNH